MMAKRFHVLLAGATALALSCVTVLPAAAQKVDKNEQKRQKEMQEAMQREARPVVLVINEWQKAGGGDAQAWMVNPKENDPTKAAVAATPAIDPKGFVFRHDMMKAADGKVYVPYTLTIPTEATGASGPIAVYLRVAPKGSQPAAQSGEKNAPNPYPFEDFFSVEPKSAGPGTAPRIMRAFAAPPGEYDIYFGMRAKPADPKKKDEQPVRVTAVKQVMTLPNFWDGTLTTSTVVITSKVDTVQGSVSPEMQRERPYLFGTTEFIPSPDNKFKKADELSVLFQIYNPALNETGKPDVTVEYTFHQKQAEGEKYFNKTSPQKLDASTLPPTFDVATTKMLPGGQSVPLASFPPGDYRMEIKVTDAISKKVITRDVLFNVGA